MEFSSLSRMERAVKKERTPATVRTVVERCSINVGVLSDNGGTSGGGGILRCGVSGPAYRQVGGERKERGGDLRNVRIAAPQCQIP